MARLDDQKSNQFLVLWTFAVIASSLAFLYWLSVRVEGIELGYDLGHSHAELSRLREVERVLELEVSAMETPERIDLVARSLLGMEEPEKTRVFGAGTDPARREEEGVAMNGGPE